MNSVVQNLYEGKSNSIAYPIIGEPDTDGCAIQCVCLGFQPSMLSFHVCLSRPMPGHWKH